MVRFSEFLFFAVVVAMLAPLQLNATDDKSGIHNCFDKTCYGPIHVFIESASETEARDILNLSCRLTGINLSLARENDLKEEGKWPSHRNLILFLDDLANTTSIHPKLVSPPDLSSDATRFGGTFSVYSNNRIYSTEFLAFDQSKTWCEDWKCWIGVTYQFLELVYDQKIIVDQEKYGEGAYCVDE